MATWKRPSIRAPASASTVPRTLSRVLPATRVVSRHQRPSPSTATEAPASVGTKRGAGNPRRARWVVTAS